MRRDITEAIKLICLLLLTICAMGIAGRFDYVEALRIEEAKHESSTFHLSKFR